MFVLPCLLMLLHINLFSFFRQSRINKITIGKTTTSLPNRHFYGLFPNFSISHNSPLRYPKNHAHYKAGATHVIANLTDYYSVETALPGEQAYVSWGMASWHIWTLDELVALKASIEAKGLTLDVIENFDPGQWYDVLLDGPGAGMRRWKTSRRL